MPRQPNSSANPTVVTKRKKKSSIPSSPFPAVLEDQSPNHSSSQIVPTVIPIKPQPQISPGIEYTICSTHLSVVDAVRVLEKSEYIVIDCEGQNIGRTNGKLSLISLATAKAERIFLLDVPALLSTKPESINPFHPLSQILGTDKIRKIVWDGRMDWLELRDTCGISLAGVLDLQLVALADAGKKRRGDIDRLLSLCRAFPIRQVMRNQSLFHGFQVVVGLQQCLEDSGLLNKDYGGKDPFITKMHRDKKGSLWMDRPLEQALLNYAATDVHLIASLHGHFLKKGLLGSKINAFLDQSKRYIQVHEERGRSEDDDIFRPGVVVPLDVLDNPKGPKYKCGTCQRSLSLSCYRTERRGEQRMRQSRCRVCAAVALKFRVPDNVWSAV